MVWMTRKRFRGDFEGLGDDISELIHNFPVTLFGKRVYVNSLDCVKFLRKLVGNHVLFLLGKHCGEVWADYVQRFTGMDGLELLEFYVDLGKVFGWGLPELVRVDLERGEGVIRVYDSFEAYDVESEKPVCHFLRGQYAGALEKILKKRVFVVETKCIAQDAPFCEFRFSPLKSRLNDDVW